MDPKSEEGIFLGYSTSSRAYRVFNTRTNVMMESVNVVVDDTPEMKERVIEEEDDDPVNISERSEKPFSSQDVITRGPTPEPLIDDGPVDASSPLTNKGPSIRIQKVHPQDNIIGSPTEGVLTRLRKLIANACFISKTKPKNVKEALSDEYWINYMQEELIQFKKNEVWNLVPRPDGINMIGTK